MNRVKIGYFLMAIVGLVFVVVGILVIIPSSFLYGVVWTGLAIGIIIYYIIRIREVL
jgi:hypothetical protein